MSDNYNAQLKEIIKRTGQTITEMADGIVDDVKGTTGFRIHVDITKKGLFMDWDEVPIITIERDIINKRVLEYLAGEENKE